MLAPADRALGDDFRRVCAVVARQLAATLKAETKIDLAEYRVLVKLAEGPRGRRRLMDVADPLPLGRSGLTRVIDRLEAAGLVRREAAPDDRRGIVAALTPAGRGTLRRATPLYAAVSPRASRARSGSAAAPPSDAPASASSLPQRERRGGR